MAAGLGFKTFTTGEVLTAGDVNGYLMQGINVFTNATARDAAITAPAEGQFAFTKDNNSLWYYDGAAWVASGATGDIEGVTAGVGISGGGTSGTVTVTNSMATAIDAKGDLVPGTGADTFSRLAVGANGTVLTADSAEATGLKWAAVSSGKIGQIVQGTTTTTTSTTSASYVNTSLSVSITPTATTSKIMLFVMASGQARSNSTNGFSHADFALAKDTTLLKNVQVLFYNFSQPTPGNPQDIRTPVSLSYLDSPATTSALTYRLRLQVGPAASGGDQATVVGDQVIIAMEVLA